MFTPSFSPGDRQASLIKPGYNDITHSVTNLTIVREYNGAMPPAPISTWLLRPMPLFSYLIACLILYK